jgi:propionyl-CoA synthetase
MSTGAYATTYVRSLEDPQGFWSEAAKDIDWITPPDRVLDDSRPPFYRWFPGATLNTCFNALDRHVAAGRSEQVAIHYDSPVTGTKRSITYTELLTDVRRLAGALVGAGVGKGDRVVIYMPMVP